MKYKINIGLAVFVSMWYWAMRVSFIFINSMTFNGLAEFVFILMLANIVFTIVTTVRKMDNRFIITAMSLNAFFLLINSVILFMALGDIKYFIMEMFKILPLVIILLGISFLLFIYPKTELVKNKMFAYITTGIVLIVMVSSVFSPVPFSIRKGPVVFDAGEHYVIVWSTSATATGWVEYTDKLTGDIVRLYETESGNIVANSKFHRVKVDKDALDNNTYQVGSTRNFLLMHTQNSARLGRSVTSEKIDFIGYNGQEEISCIVLADVHGYNRAAIKAANHLGNYDFLVLLGDITNSINSEYDINSILGLASDFTNGAKPVIYQRGNHETRGKYANNLRNYLGLDDFNYTLRYGPLAAIVLDTGEDKDDDHEEYSGLAQYNEYRIKQTEWLESVQTSLLFNDATIQYKVVFGHIALKEYDDEDPRTQWTQIINSIDIDAYFAGHRHATAFIEPDDNLLFPTLICGGRKGSLGRYFDAMKVTFTPDGIVAQSANQDGENLFEKTF